MNGMQILVWLQSGGSPAFDTSQDCRLPAIQAMAQDTSWQAGQT